ncbi:hypothetical protein ZWY2020_036949 [Hordeum vulgare]|nr:hypothetical protein ZWY2020_036949 [Hordeum vulgare]
MAAWPGELWKRWSIQILVLLSLGLQVALFLFAGIRRRGAHPVLRSLLWLAYQLADYTATFALGHLSLKGAPRDHPIVALWAPFLLLHLGGPDNITAYSLEDSKLWKRHLLHAVLQVSGAVYVLYEHIADRGASLLLASVLMFAIGAVKYGEKTWALMRGNLDSIRGSIEKQPPAMHGHFHPQDRVLKDEELDEESLVRRAHSLFHICKRAVVDYPVMEDDSHGQDTAKMIGEVKLWRLMETELSLMYDTLYTKAPVIHTWFGYSVRLVSPLAIVASLLLFKFIDKDDDNRSVDVYITYVLYGGALFMETTSLLNALGSSWTFAFLSTTRWRWLRYAALCNERWDRLRRVVAYLHHLVRVGGGSRYTSRRWSYTMGQYNMLHFCTRSVTRPLLGRLAKMVGFGLNEVWNREHHSWVIDMPDHVKDCISRHMNKMYKEGAVNSLGMLRNRWGKETLVSNKLFTGIFKDSLGVEFQECIIIWHVCSDVFLAKSDRAKEEEAWLDVEAIRVISNYMMFLLVEQPDMLPGLPQNRMYQRTCENLVKIRRSTHRRQSMNLGATLKNLFRLHDDPGSSSRIADREELARNVYDEYESRSFSYDAPRLPYVAQLAKQLLTMEKDGTLDSVKLVLDVWTDILVYAGNKCSRKAHAEKLNSGGELTTILWLMAEHFYQLYLGTLIRRKKMDLGEGISHAGA